MKKIVITAMCVMLGGMLSTAMAGGSAGCATGVKACDASVKEAKASCGAACLKGLELTAEQQAKVDALKAECDGVECKVTSAKKMKTGLKDILSAEQVAKLKTKCEGCSKAISG